MGIAPPSLSEPLIAAFTAVRGAVNRAPSLLASALQCIRQPMLPPPVQQAKTGCGESRSPPESRQAEAALQMLLLTDGLHPLLQAALQAIVVEHLQRLPPAAERESSVVKAITQALCTGCTLQDACDALPKADRDAVWRGGPYRDVDPVRHLLLNYLALFQGQVIEMALTRGKTGTTAYLELPEGFAEQQTELQKGWERVEKKASKSEALVEYRQLNQWLCLQEWFVQLPLGVVQRFVTVLLLRHFALTPLARQLIACCRGQVSAQTLGDDWRMIGSQLKHASTPSEFLDGISSALEQGPLSLSMLMYGLYRLTSMTLPSMLLSVFLGAVAEAGQQALAGRLRKHVGSPALEFTHFLQSLNRLTGNCASLKQHAQPPLDVLLAWLNPAPAAPLGITHLRYDDRATADVRMRWIQDQRLFERSASLPSSASEPLSTSVGSRPAGVVQLVRQVARGVVRGAVGMMWRAPAVIEREVDVQAPLYHQDPYAVYRPTTTPLIATAQSRCAVAGLGAVTVSGATVALYRAARRPDTADLMPTPAGPGNGSVFTELTPHGEAVWQALSHFHQNRDGTLTSTLRELHVMLADPAAADDERVRLARVMALLQKDFGPALAGLRDLIQSGPEADFAEFDAPESVPVRQRRDVEARTVPQEADEAMAREVIAWVTQALVSARWQDTEIQLQVFGEWVKGQLPADHWLQTASPQERALWLEHQQRLADSYQRLARLDYDSLEPFKAQRPALQKALAEVDLSELLLTVLESKLKGDLYGGSYIPGLEVMTAALNGDPQVTVGRLQLSTGQGPDALTLIIPKWQVFVRRNAGGEEDGVVVYCPAEHKIGTFSTQQEIIQHLDLMRLRQSLQAQVQPPATPAGLQSRLVTRPNLGPFNTPRVPRPLPEVVLEAVPLGQRASWQHFFEQYGRQPHRWTSAHVQVVDADVNLHASLERRAGAQLDREQARLQARLDDPGLSSQEDVLLQARRAFAEFNDEYFPTLRTVAQRGATAWLTKTLHHEGVVPANATVDADTLIITFNGRSMSLTDGVQEGYRRTADNVFAPSNNFIQYATIEHEDPAVARAMNQPHGKQGLQEYLRSTYPATDFIKNLEQRLEPEDELGQRWRGLYKGLIKQGLQVALARAKGAGQLDRAPHQALKRLVDGLPDTTRGGASLHALHIGRVRIPEVLVLSQEGDDYVYLDGPYGLELLKRSDYLQRLNTPAYRDDLQARTLTRDETLIDNALRGAVGEKVHTVPIKDFNREVIQQWLHDQIDNAREAATSRNQVRWEQALKGLRFTVGALCMTGSAGIAAVACGAGTFGLAAHDVNGASRKLARGQLNEALGDVATLWLDTFDVVSGLVALRKVLHWAGKVRFSSTDEFASDVQTMVRQRNRVFTPLGRLNDVLARGDITLQPESKLSVRPGKAQAGDFYAIDGKYFILNRYQDQGRVYEVYSDDAWATVRVRDPLRPNGHGEPVHYRNGHWQPGKGGLLGGGAGSSSLGTAEKSHLLGEGAGSSGFSSEEQWNTYFQLFRLDPDIRSDAQVIRALRSAIENHKPLPQSSFGFLKNKSDGWRAYGIFGQKPFDPNALEKNFDPNTLKQIAADFDFSDAPTGHALGEWLLDDALRYGTHGKADWPLWAIKYARKETILNYYTPEQVLIGFKAFPGASVTHAYLKEFDCLKKEVRKRLLADRIMGHEVPLDEFPERVLLAAKQQALIKSADFADERAVAVYVAAFSFPADADILKMALLRARINGGRTPAWAGAYLQHESWRPYRDAQALPPEARRLALQQVLVSEKIHSDPERAAQYLFKQFNTLDETGAPMWDLCEELVLATLLEGAQRPVWAIERVVPSALMNIFRSEDIPADMSRLEIVISPGSLEPRLLLPEQMTRLLYLKIVCDSAVSTPFEVRLPTSMFSLKELHLEGIIVRQALPLDRMRALEKLHVINCSGEKKLHLSYLSELKSAQISRNSQLREFRVGRGCNKLETLDVTYNPQLREMVLDWSLYELRSLSVTFNPSLQPTKSTFPAALTELRTLVLRDNNLADVSFLRNVRLAQLSRLDLSHNQLRSLPPLPRLPMLEIFQLEGNAFRDIPGFVMDLATPVKVNMGDNFISSRALRHFESQIPYRYPNQADVEFGSLADAASGSTRRLGEMVAICSPGREGEAWRSLWLGFEGEAHATEFSTFLGRLYQSDMFDDEVFRQAVSGWLERLETSAEFRREKFRAADSTCASCEDWVSWVYNNMREIDLRFDV